MFKVMNMFIVIVIIILVLVVVIAIIIIAIVIIRIASRMCILFIDTLSKHCVDVECKR